MRHIVAVTWGGIEAKGDQLGVDLEALQLDLARV